MNDDYTRTPAPAGDVKEVGAEVRRIMDMSDEEILAEADVSDVAWARGFKQGLKMGSTAASPTPDRQTIAEIIDPYSFCDVPFTDDPTLLDMVEQSKGDALRKADRVIAALASPTPDSSAVSGSAEGLREALRRIERKAVAGSDRNKRNKGCDSHNDFAEIAQIARAALTEGQQS